jgi:hypothetical protein
MEMFTRIYVPLEENERRALIRLSPTEKRDPRKQVALFIRRELEHLGLLPPAPTAPKSEAQRERS